MEYRERSERHARRQTGPANGPPGSGIFRRDGTLCERNELPDRGGLPGRSQSAGGDSGRERQDDDPKLAEPLLRATELGRQSELRRSSPAGGGNSGLAAASPQRLIDSLNTAIILLDENLLVVYLNPAAENLLGVSQRRAERKPLLPLVDDDREFSEVLARVLETGVTYANEIRLGPSEVQAEHRMIDCRVSLFSTDAGDTALLVEMTDVTRRLKINRENALIIQHGAGRQMVRQLAHEIKNPLGGLRGAAQLLDRQLDSEELHEYTKVIISEADRLADLVDTLLGPGGPPNKKPVNIHELVEYVIRVVAPESTGKLTIRRDYDPGLPMMNLDRDQIVQALLNLVRNAATALEGHGQITLRTRAIMNFTIGDTRHRVVAGIEIEDDGPGIPPDLQDSVFYPLVTSRPDGTGLGLPAAQELLSRHGGLIEFDSRPGRTTFFIRIPLDDDGPHRRG